MYTFDRISNFSIEVLNLYVYNEAMYALYEVNTSVCRSLKICICIFVDLVSKFIQFYY